MGQAAIAAVAFIGGMVFAQVWPLLVRYVDGLNAPKVTLEVGYTKGDVAKRLSLQDTFAINAIKGKEYVAEMESKPINPHREAIYRQICEAVDAENEANQSPIPNTGILNPHRRIGIAERRRMAELASLRAPTHQAAVTANNARAMETK